MIIKTTSTPTPTPEPLWARRPSRGNGPYYTDPHELWLDCVSYFEWVEDNPVITIDVVKYGGEINFVDVPRPRPMTKGGLCVFLGINRWTWHSWRKRDDLIAEMVATVDDIIFEQKFAGACVGLFHPVLIARELGLMNREPEQPILFDPDDLPKISADMSPGEAADLYARTLAE